MYGIIMFATACFCCDTFTKALPGVFKVAVYWKVQEGLVRVKAEWKVHTKLSSKRNERVHSLDTLHKHCFILYRSAPGSVP